MTVMFTLPFNTNSTKLSNRIKQFVGNLPTNYLSVFDHFMGLALKGLTLPVPIPDEELLLSHFCGAVISFMKALQSSCGQLENLLLQRCPVFDFAQYIEWSKYVYFFDRVFLVLTQLHCSSFSTKDFGVAVNPLFCPALTGSFPYFSYKEVLDFQKINLFTIILFNIFL